VAVTRTVLTACAGALIAAGYASAGASSTDSPLQLQKQMFKWFGSGQYRQMYDHTYPAQRKAIEYSRYLACARQAMEQVRAHAIDPLSVRVIRGRVGSSKKVVNVPGTRLRVRATPVWVWTTAVVSGKRITVAPGPPDYFVRVGGKWSYIDRDIGDMLNCGD
jgi:hypothetical protein